MGIRQRKYRGVNKTLMLAACSLLILNPSPAQIIDATIKGLVCPSCAIGIKKQLNKTKKVEKVKLDIEKEVAHIYLIKGKTLTDKEVHKAIKNAGYEVSKITRHEK
jgi:copper chaperone CopZ